jgi:hypothetical protein
LQWKIAPKSPICEWREATIFPGWIGVRQPFQWFGRGEGGAFFGWGKRWATKFSNLQ